MTNTNIMVSEETISQYGPMITSICRRLIQDPEIAKDAAQEVWIQIIKSRPAFKGESKLSTWIYTIAYRVAKDYSIRAKRKLANFMKDECMLYNPDGKCRCRMKGHITESGLADEYRKIKDVVNRVSLFQRFEKTLPKKDYWEKII